MKKIILLGIVLMAHLSAEPIRGAMMKNGCYVGNFIDGVVCEKRDLHTSLPLGIEVSMTLEASYEKDNGRYPSMKPDYVSGYYVTIPTSIQVNDPQNKFNPESGLPIIVRAVICSFSRACYYSVDSQSLVLSRDYGTRTFKGNFTFHMQNNFGAEQEGRLEKIEILAPGIDGIQVIVL